MRFASLGSGSRGNATLVEVGTTRVLVDCGFSVRETERRLANLGLAAVDVTAILVTHEHSDHISGVAALSRKCGIPVWATLGTWSQHGAGEVAQRGVFNCHETFALGDIEVRPFPVPHDAREPSQFVFSDGAVSLGVLTDTGCVTPHIVQQLSGCDALLLECNHDEDMLANGSYPPALKRRVGGQFGHLSNAQAAALLGAIDCSRFQHVVAAHLSAQNNTPALAGSALSAVLGCSSDWVGIAAQDVGLAWRSLG